MDQAQPASPQQPMQPEKHSGARNFFFYFLSFVLLYIVTISLGGVLFQIINKTLPQAAQIYSGQFSAGALRYNLASLIIGTPLFLWLARKVYKDEQSNESMRQSGIRRWLTYLTLIIAALIVIGDLIYLVYSLLGGETTMRFIFKSLVVLIIAGAVFYYYLTDVKGAHKGGTDSATKNMLPRAYFYAVIIAVLASVITGFFFIESPIAQRQRAQDNVRLSNLQELKGAIDNYTYTNNMLPATFADAKLREGIDIDPITKQPYTYQIVDPTHYKLCATFETSNRDLKAGDEGYNYYGNEWLHDKGETCFTQIAPPLSNQKVPVINFPTTFPPSY